MKFTVYYQIFEKKIKTTVAADSQSHAVHKVESALKIIKVDNYVAPAAPEESEVDWNFFNLFRKNS